MKISTDGVTFALETESGNGYFYSREKKRRTTWYLNIMDIFTILTGK